MPLRNLTLALVIASLPAAVFAKDKHKQELPDIVLQAHTVFVTVDTDAADSARNPGENQQAVRAVEQALMRWGRFSFATDARTADLVISVQKGHSGSVNPTMGRGGNTPPVVMNPGQGGVMIGGHQGTPPPLTDPSGMPQDTGPRPGAQIGQSQDTLKVYQGGGDYPLDGAPIWRYAGDGALSEPAVNAVTQFRKAIERSEQAKSKKP
jgi:hypothetical protein